jgi:hypothetical protein
VKNIFLSARNLRKNAETLYLLRALYFWRPLYSAGGGQCEGVEEALAGRMKQCPQGSPQCVIQGGGIVAGIVPSTCPGINPSRFHNNSFILLPVFSASFA